MGTPVRGSGSKGTQRVRLKPDWWLATLLLHIQMRCWKTCTACFPATVCTPPGCFLCADVQTPTTASTAAVISSRSTSGQMASTVTAETQAWLQGRVVSSSWRCYMTWTPHSCCRNAVNQYKQHRCMQHTEPSSKPCSSPANQVGVLMCGGVRSTMSQFEQTHSLLHPAVHVVQPTLAAVMEPWT